MTDSYDREDVSREVIKCVIVGDSAVGKTRLICARACDQKVGLEQLLAVHTPTVWAIDRYRMSREILEKSFQSVDNVPVSLRLWDTFGDHNNDRRFAYGRSDVVLLCFSVLNPRSLHHARTVWYPEIRRMCPGAPVVLVGCKNDLRHLCFQSWFQKLVAERRPFGKPILPKDIVFPEQGRLVAKEIGAPYYETSVLTFFGIYDLFANVIRAALCRRRQVRFWMTTLDSVRPPLLQSPYLPPRPEIPPLQIAQSCYRDHLLNAARFIMNSTSFRKSTVKSVQHQQKNRRSGELGFFDCLLEFQSNAQSFLLKIPSHRLILASSSALFKDVLVCSSENCPHCSKPDRECLDFIYSLGSPGLCDDDDTRKLLSSSVNDIGIISAASKSQFDLKLENRDGKHFERTPQCFATNFSSRNSSFRIKMTRSPPDSVVTLKLCLLTEQETQGAEEVCRCLLYFMYSGEIPSKISDAGKKLLVSFARAFSIPLLEKLVEGEGDHYTAELIRRQFLEDRNATLVYFSLNCGLFCDAKFLVEKEILLGASRFMLANRCEVMEAMFSDQFREGLSSQVHFSGVSCQAVKKLFLFLYTDSIDSDEKEFSLVDSIETVELANRLCLPRLVSLVENVVVKEFQHLITKKYFGDEGAIVEDVLNTLEAAQMYNAAQLSAWCLNFLSCNYNRACKQFPKLVKNLSQANQDFLATNRWPPIWYLKEFDSYERSLRDRQQSEQVCISGASGRLKRARTRSGCLCFSKTSRKQGETGSI